MGPHNLAVCKHKYIHLLCTCRAKQNIDILSFSISVVFYWSWTYYHVLITAFTHLMMIYQKCHCVIWYFVKVPIVSPLILRQYPYPGIPSENIMFNLVVQYQHCIWGGVHRVSLYSLKILQSYVKAVLAILQLFLNVSVPTTSKNIKFNWATAAYVSSKMQSANHEWPACRTTQKFHRASLCKTNIKIKKMPMLVQNT